VGKSAVVLLSGGLDSATTLFLARRQGYRLYPLIFDYGQRHAREVGSAKNIARRFAGRYTVLRIELPWRGSSLLDKKAALPISTTRAPSRGAIPSTYVPARNLIFLSFAVSYAETIGAEAIYIGANAIDFSGYPDCRPAFYRAFRRTAVLGTRAGVESRPIKVLTPLIRKTKAQIIKLGLELGVPYQDTWSCYRGTRRPCGRCDACLLRAKGFREAGVEDPLTHES
jgi:7-cyano-7-deazaguanine synthase